MLFEGRHRIRFDYSRPVFVEPHVLRLCPRSDPVQRLRGFDLVVEPSPAGMTQGLDADGNEAAWVWFDGLQEHLTVTTSFEVETLRDDPFDFVLPTAAHGRVPVPYGEVTRRTLGPALVPSDPSEEVRTFALDTLDGAGGELLPFLYALSDRIYRTSEVIIRPEGEPFAAARTLTDARGSCRDLVVLYMDCCRHAGIAARFVSGYQEGDPDQKERDLHAWAEAYVPGGGWRGYDPTHGLAVADRHIALAASPFPLGAAPTRGRFRGTGATSTMTVNLDLHVGSEEPGADGIR